MKQIIFEQLSAMGFEPTELGEIGYAFSYDDLNYLYMPQDGDEQFLRIAIPQMFEVTDENRIAVLEAMHDTSSILKYTKMCIMYETSAWAIYEHHLSVNENLSDILEHIIRTLAATAYIFYQKMYGENVVESLMESAESDEGADDDLEAQLKSLLEGVENE